VSTQPTYDSTVDEIVARKQAANKEFDDAVQERFIEAADAAGLLDERDELDDELVAQRVYQELKSKRVVNIDPGNDDRRDPTSSSTKDELTAAIFTAGPTALDAERDDVERAVYAKCVSAVWNPTQTGKRGRVQKMFDSDSLILVRGKVFREPNPIKDGIYVSTHEEIVMREFWGPRLDRLRKLASALEDDYEMVKERVPALDAPMRAAIEAAFVEATAKLPVPTLGTGDGQKAIGK
jgi:hypothetical protein